MLRVSDCGVRLTRYGAAFPIEADNGSLDSTQKDVLIPFFTNRPT
jgi:hypothetical protein